MAMKRIGFVLFLSIVSAAALDPARSLGPALVGGVIDSQWIYLLGPIAGAVAGATVYRFLRCGGGIIDGGRGCC